MFEQLLKDTAGPSLIQTSEMAAKLIAQLDSAGNINLKSGMIEVDDEKVRAILREFLPQETADHYVDVELQSLKSQRLAVFGTPDEIEKGQGVAVPWPVIEQLALEGNLSTDIFVALNNMGPKLDLSSLNIELTHMAENYGTEANRQLVQLFEDNRRRAAEQIALEEKEARTEEERRRAEEQRRALEQEARLEQRRQEMERQSTDAASCLMQAEWGIHWWGISICISHDCASLLQSILSSAGGGDRLRAAVEGALRAGASGALAAVASLTAGIIASIYAFVLATVISLVNGPNGVCLNINWPAI